MSDQSRQDIRKLLKAFGIQADQALTEHLDRAPGSEPLRIRLRLEDMTDYGEGESAPPLGIELEGRIRR